MIPVLLVLPDGVRLVHCVGIASLRALSSRAEARGGFAHVLAEVPR